VSCQAELACPAPLLQSGGVPGPQCSGRGICAAPSAAFLSAARTGNAAAAGNRSSISANDLLDSRANVTQQGTAGGRGGSGSDGGSDGTGGPSAAHIAVQTHFCGLRKPHHGMTVQCGHALMCRRSKRGGQRHRRQCVTDGRLGAGRRGDGGGAVLAGAKPVPVPSRVCTCRAGYGDVGCNVPVPMLAQGQVITRNVSSGGWTFTQLDVRPHQPPPGCADNISAVMLHSAFQH
jgi:hypothetical protein